MSLVFIMATNTQKVFAIAENHDNIPIHFLYPRGDTGDNDGPSMECTLPNGRTHGHRQNHWISPSNNSGSTTATPAPGANSMLLKMNVLLGTCNSVLKPHDSSGNIDNFSLRNTRFKITSSRVESTSGSLSLSGLTGAEVTNPTDLMHFFNARFAKKNEAGKNIPYYSLFSLIGLESLTSGRNTITITAQARPINEYVGGVFRCVADDDGRTTTGGFPTSLNDSRCASSPAIFVFYIDIPVPDKPTTFTVFGDCDNGIFGRVRDLDVSPGSMKVNIYKDDELVKANWPVNENSSNDSSYNGWVYRFEPGDGFSDHNDLSSHTWRVDIVSKSGVVKPDAKTVDVGPCASVSCTTNVVPGLIEPGKDLQVEISGSISNFGSEGSSPPGFRAIYAIRNEDIGTTEAGPTSQSWGSWSSSKDFSFDVPGGVSDVGNYKVDGRINWTGAPTDPTDPPNTGVSCDKTFDSSWVPYMKFYGNDIYAGAAFKTINPSCSFPESAKSDIKGDSILSGFDVARGSSVEYASFATGATEGLFTAGMRIGATTPTSVATGLGFGNFNGSKALRGDYNGERCLPDFNTEVPASAEEFNGPQTTSGPSGPNKLVLGTVSGDRYIIINGNLTIDNNVFLADFAGIGQIPNLVVVVNGNITISRNVTDVQGVYIAQPKIVGMDIEGGTVHTCAGVSAKDIIVKGCGSSIYKLRFKGALVAKHVDFYRGFGLLDKDSTTNENVDSPTISESYEFLPEIYVRQTVNTDKADIDVKYDFITSLPPVL